MKKLLLVMFLVLSLSACAPVVAAPVVVAPPQQTKVEAASTLSPTKTTPVPLKTMRPTSTSTSTSTSTPKVETDPRNPAKWDIWPVVPEYMNPEFKEIYRQGIAEGNDPHVFSKAGDCQSVPSHFLGNFDLPGSYNLGGHDELSQVIEYFRGSWGWFAPSIRGGQNIAAVRQESPYHRIDDNINNQDKCSKEESFIACEVRLRHPSILLISFEEGSLDSEKYERHLKSLIDFALERKIIPIIGNSASNKEINATIARVAVEKGVPVWNLWAAEQPLPNRGLDPGLNDGFHLGGTTDKFSLGHPNGWTVRNLTALQTIDVIWRELNK